MNYLKNVIAFSLLLTIIVAIASSCGRKKSSNVIIAPKPEVVKPSAPVRMSEYTHTDNVEWLGKTYKVEVIRSVADSLPMVKDDQGMKYFDNMIRVKVIRPDGTEFFNRLFSKAAFKDYIDDNTRNHGVLLGVVLDKAEGDNLILGASVGSPDILSDEYIPLLITISRMGNVSIARDSHLDSEEPQDADSDI